jgi:hypothetical protein
MGGTGRRACRVRPDLVFRATSEFISPSPYGALVGDGGSGPMLVYDASDVGWTP